MKKNSNASLTDYGFWIALSLLLLFYWRLLATAQLKSITYDEVLHVFRGALYWLQGVYSVVQNPPLVNAVIGLPLSLTFRPTFPADIQPVSDWLSLSKDFMWQSNATGLQMLAVGRLAIIWLATLLAALVYRWGGQLFKARTAGLLALILFSFDPNVLAHSHLATSDLGTAFFYFVAGYAIWSYWRPGRPRGGWRYLATGLAIGLALAAKFSGLVIVPAVILIALYRLFSERAEAAEWRRSLLEVAGWLVIGVLVFLLAYRFSWETIAIDWSWQREHQLNGRLGFLLGEFGRGWWYYFPFVALIKNPVPTLLLFALGLGLYIWRRRWDWQTLWPLLLAGGVFGASMVSRVNMGYRFVLPMIAPLAVFLGQLAQPGYLQRRAVRWTAAAAVVAMIIISLATHPHYLAYFNRLSGGPDNAWRLVIDSNIDWGQDLLGLADYVDEQGIEFVNANVFGTGTLEAYGINGRNVLGWPVEKENPLYDWFYPPRPAPGFYALSATQLQGLYLKEDKGRFNWFKQQAPLDKIGYSIFLYDVPPDGEEVGLALSGIGIGTITEDDFSLALQSNDVHPRWYDARAALLWPGGSESGKDMAAWAAVGDGHLPAEPMLQSLYPAGGPQLQGIGEDGLRYSLFNWQQSPIQELLATEGPDVRSSFGWTAEAKLGSEEWETAQRLDTAVFGSSLQLLGYQPAWTEPLRAGDTLELLSMWRVINPPQEDVKLFLHVVNEAGEVVAQHDGLDVLVEGLQPGDELAQWHRIALPQNLDGGTYGLQIGVYHTADTSRLLLESEEGDRVLLQTVTLTAR